MAPPATRAQVFERPSASRVVAGGTWQIIAGTVGGLLIFAWIFLGGRPEPKGFGKAGFEFFITANAATVLLSASTVGVGQAFVRTVSRALARDRDEARRLAARSSRVMLLWGSLLGAAWLAFTFLGGNRPEDVVAFSLVALFVPFMLLRDIVNSVIGSVHRFDYLAVESAFLGVAVLLTGLAFLAWFRSPAHAPYLAAAPLVGVVVMLVSALLLFRRCSPFRLRDLFSERADRAFTRDLSSYGLYALLSNFATNGLNLQLSIFTVKVMSIYGLVFAPADVTLYGLATLYSFMVLYITQMALPLIPEVARARELGDRDLLHSVLRTMLKFGFSLAPFLAVMLAVSGPAVLPLFTPEARGQWWPMILSVAGMGLYALSTVCSAVLVGAGRAREAGRVFGVAALLMVLLTPLLSFPFGLAGPALALLLSGAILLPVLLRRVGREMEFRIPWSILLRPLVASALVAPLFLPGLPALGSPGTAWVKMAFALLGAFLLFVVYMLVLTAIGFYGEEDYALIEDTATSFGLRPVGLLGARLLRRLHRASPFTAKG